MSLTCKVPQLRFREFGGEWEEKKLGEVTTYVDYRGRAPTKTEEGHFLVTAKNIKKGFIDYECSKEYVAESDYLNVMSKGLPEIGDVLFTTEAPMGNVAQVDDKNIALAQRVIKFRSKKMLSNLYLLHYMLSAVFQKSISEKSIGTTVQGISGKELHRIRLAFPFLHEQEKIASFLSSVDTRIEQLTKKKTLLEQYKKGVMQKIFSQELRFKDDDGSEYPEWVEKKLGEVGIISTGKTPSTTDNSLWDGDIKFITPTDIKDNVKYQIHTQRTVLKQSKMKVLETGSIVYTCIASIGKMAITTYPSITNQQINSVTVNQNNNNEFIYYQLLKLTPFIQSTQANTTLPIINKTEFSKFKINLPSLKEQTKIANFLSSLDEKLLHVSQQLDSTKQFKKALLQQMFV